MGRESVETGCQSAFVSVPWSAGGADASVAEAVSALLGQLRQPTSSRGAVSARPTGTTTTAPAPAAVTFDLNESDRSGAKGDWRDVFKFYQETNDESARRRTLAGGPAGAAQAKARFELVEVDFARYEKIKLAGSQATQKKTLAAKRQMLAELEARYVEVLEYQSFEWTVAVFVRVGDLYQLFAQMLYDAPDPPGLSDEVVDLFRTQIEEQAVKWENIAIERYAVAVAKARELKIVNDWTRRALRELHKYNPAEYPLFEAEKR